MPSIYIHADSKAVADGINRVIGRKLQKITDSDTKDKIAGIYAQYIEKYVPSKSGRLHSSATVKNGEIRYSAKAKRPGGNYDYAKLQYMTPFPQENRYTPGTYDHWNKHLTTSERQSMYGEMANIVAEEMNRG